MTAYESMRLDQADLARDAKKEQAMCASAICTASHKLKPAPSGYRGRYGGDQLCPKHYRQVVDHIAAHGCLPSEHDCDEHRD